MFFAKLISFKSGLCLRVDFLPDHELCKGEDWPVLSVPTPTTMLATAAI